MLIKLLSVCVCRSTLPLDQNGIENVMIQYSAGPHQRHVAEGMYANLAV